jgi:RNA polymerase sigma-70 factor, ECF subfamily
MRPRTFFLSLWRAAASFDRAKGPEGAFIAMITRRRLIDRMRQWKSELEIDYSVDVTEAVNGSEPGTSPEVSLEAETAMKFLQLLGPQQRRTLELGFVHGLSQAEISAQLQIPLGTVKSHMRRGLIRMRECLQFEAQAESSKHRARPPSIAKQLPSMRVGGRPIAQRRQRFAPGTPSYI